MDNHEENVRARQGGMSRLRRLQLQSADRLRREYFRTRETSRVNTVWVRLFGYLLDDVRLREAELDRKYENLWHDNEDYLSKLDIFIETLKNFSTAEVADEEIKKRQEDIKKDVEVLEQKIAEKSRMLVVMSRKLKGLHTKKEELSKIKQTAEFTILSNWVRATCDKCVAMENEITEIKLRIGRKNEDVLEFLGFGHNIFSKVNIEDLKKVPPFKTAAKPSTSSNTSSQ